MSQEDVEVVRNALTAYAERGLDTGGATTSSRRTLQVEDQKKRRNDDAEKSGLRGAVGE
jgi:hypothetical protein